MYRQCFTRNALYAYLKVFFSECYSPAPLVHGSRLARSCGVRASWGSSPSAAGWSGRLCRRRGLCGRSRHGRWAQGGDPDRALGAPQAARRVGGQSRCLLALRSSCVAITSSFDREVVMASGVIASSSAMSRITCSMRCSLRHGQFANRISRLARSVKSCGGMVMSCRQSCVIGETQSIRTMTRPLERRMQTATRS